MNILCSLSGARLMNDVSRMIHSKLSSMHRTVVMVSFVYGLAFHNLYPSKIWTIGLGLLFIRPCIGRRVCDWHNLNLSMAQTNVPQITSCLKLQTCVPWCLFLLFESNSWMVHPCVQGIYPSMLVCLSWIILDECIKE